MNKCLRFGKCLTLIAIALLAVLWCAGASAETSGTWGDLTWTLDDEGLLTISGEGEMENFPYSSKTYAWKDYNSQIRSIVVSEGVTTLGENAFKDCNGLSSITLPEGITSIERNAFQYCSSLTSITIPESVTSIGRYAFSGCRSLSSITLPEGITYINIYEFENCGSLMNITIPEGVTGIGDYAFSGCSSLVSITIPEGVTGIEDYAFSGCSSLVSITIPEGVTRIRERAFSGCSSLTSIALPESLRYIGSWAFYGCDKLSDLHIGSIESWVDIDFYNHYSHPNEYATHWYIDGKPITSITLPEGITSINDYEFKNCSSLVNITIPEEVTNIGERAFSGCSNLTSITLPESLKSIGSWAFYGCDKLSDLHIGSIESWLNIDFSDGNSHPNMYATHWYIDGKPITSITLPEGITSISNYTFYHCSSLTSITLPESLRYIGALAFGGCSNLSDLHIGSIEAWVSIDFDSESSYPNSYATHWYIDGKPITSITLPEGITSINDYEFKNCSSLVSITIPEGVTNIGERAFSGCSNLTSITLPESLKSIGSFAFYDCDKISELRIGSIESWLNVDFPNNYTRFSCPSQYGANWYIDGELITSITLPEGITSINKYAFYNCSSLMDIKIPEGVTSIGENAFYGCSSLTSIALPERLRSIGAGAFSSCEKLSTLYIGSVESWLNIDFSDKDSYPNIYATHWYIDGKPITSITLPEGMTSIDDYTFCNCRSLMSIAIPDSVTEIGNYAFSGCSNLTSITIPEGVTSIGEVAFSGCSSLTSVAIPEGVTTIAVYAFSGCSSLTRVTLPEGLTSINNYAFYGCWNTDLYIPDAVTSFGDQIFGYNTYRGTIYCHEYSDADYWATEKGYKVVCVDDVDIEAIRTISLPGDFRMACGEAWQILANVFPDYDHPEVHWFSDAPEVVSVADGLLTALKPGQAVITATVGEQSASVTVTTYIPAEDFELPAELWVVAKEQTYIAPLSVAPAGAEVDIAWTSGDESIATVDSLGQISGKKPGDVTVTGTYKERAIVRTATVHVCYPVTEVAFADDTLTVKCYKTAQLTANVTMRTQSCVNQLVTFASSDEAVATVDEDGWVTGRAKGVVTITATASSGVSGSCQVIVADELNTLTLPEGLTAIDSGAFASMPNVDAVRIPAGVAKIAEDAFEGTDPVIFAPSGSYAAQWAAEHGFTLVEE